MYSALTNKPICPKRHKTFLIFPLLACLLVFSSPQVATAIPAGVTTAIWSFDGNHAVVGRYVPQPGKQDGPIKKHEVFLCTGQLKPIGLLHGPSTGLYPVNASFSRDNEWVYYEVPQGEMTDSLIMRKGLTHDAPAERFAKFKNDLVLAMIPAGHSDELIVQLMSNPRALYRCSKTKKVGLIQAAEKDIKFLTPYLVDKAHRDSLSSQTLLLRASTLINNQPAANSPDASLRSSFSDLELWHVPLNAKNAPPPNLLKNEILDPTIYSASLDGGIQISLTNSKDAATIQIATQSISERTFHTPGGGYILDRNQVVWIDPAKRSLNIASSKNPKREILSAMPTKDAVIVGFNSDLGIIALQDKESYYAVDVMAGKTEKYVFTKPSKRNE